MCVLKCATHSQAHNGEIDQLIDVSFCFVQNWGMEVKLKNLVLPCLNIKGFSMKTRQSSRTAKQWKDIEFLVEEFDFVQYVKNRYPDLEQD